jgi:hypothetical protein
VGASNLSGLQKTIAHGIIGGTGSVANGGKFGAGFLSMGFTKGMNVKFGDLGYLGSAVVGGIGSRLGGGKFAHGAVAGTLSYALNSRLSRKTIRDRISTSTATDDDYHEYRIRGEICSVSTAGCNADLADEVYKHVNSNDIPFTDNDLVQGRHELGPLRDPIRHIEDVANRTSVNIALEGHTFYPGTVTHRVHFQNGSLY